MAYASGVVSAIGAVFLVAMFVCFALGAQSTGLVFGAINDAVVIVWGAIALPLPVALHGVLRPKSPVVSTLAMALGLAAIVAIMILQAMLLSGSLTFERQIGPVSIAFLALAVWLVAVGYLGSSSGILPNGARMGLIGATYFGYPFWAFWLARHFRRIGAEPLRGAPGMEQLRARRG